MGGSRTFDGDPLELENDIQQIRTLLDEDETEQEQESIEPMSGKTIVLPPEEASQEIANEVIEASRANYATIYRNESKPQSGKKPKPDNKDSDGKKGKGGKKQGDKNKDGDDPKDADDDK